MPDFFSLVMDVERDEIFLQKKGDLRTQSISFSARAMFHLKVAPAVTRTVRVTHKFYVRKESEKNKKGKTKNIATNRAQDLFFRSESVHVSISFLCERVATLRWQTLLQDPFVNGI